MLLFWHDWWLCFSPQAGSENAIGTAPPQQEHSQDTEVQGSTIENNSDNLTALICATAAEDMGLDNTTVLACPSDDEEPNPAEAEVPDPEEDTFDYLNAALQPSVSIVNAELSIFDSVSPHLC